MARVGERGEFGSTPLDDLGDADVEVRDLDPAFDLSLFAEEAPRPQAAAPARSAPDAAAAARAPVPAPIPDPRHHVDLADPRLDRSVPELTVRPPAAPAGPVAWLRARIEQRRAAAACAVPTPRPPESDRPQSHRRARAAAAAAVVIALLATALFAWMQWPVPGVAVGEVRIDSTPTGALVMIDDQLRGPTPLALRLAPGVHRLRIDHAGASHATELRVDAGRTSSHHVQFTVAGTSVRTARPAAARNGNARSADSAGAPRAPSGAAAPRPAATSGRARVPASPPPPPVMPDGALAGWVTVAAPVELQMMLDGKVVGTSRADRTMLPAGTHRVEFTNDRVGFRVSQDVTITPGGQSTVAVDVPPGALSLNALPWAEVFVDDRPLGETPLGEVSLAAGVHRIVFRHPELGERAHEALVRAGQHTRLSVDLRR